MMDIQLPVLDGYEAARRIKKDPMLARIPIIAVTSYALFGDEDTGRWLRWLYPDSLRTRKTALAIVCERDLSRRHDSLRVSERC
jgi:CheY-like chemotaxis protein